MGFFEIKCPSKFDLDHNVMMQVKYRTICMKSFMSVSRQYFVHLTIPSLRASFRFEKYRDKSSANGTRTYIHTYIYFIYARNLQSSCRANIFEKAILHGTIRNDDFSTYRCNIVATLFQMVATLFQHCNAVLR